ncbi:oxidoreductase-like domain-containing protein 1, partial [Haliotis asinina]|uniref:oxidoreductase-like domain-containing protein 1 n=1 Tax=Haliotis asinina TaxID=109174 RepID=UPI00353271D7
LPRGMLSTSSCICGKVLLRHLQNAPSITTETVYHTIQVLSKVGDKSLNLRAMYSSSGNTNQYDDEAVIQAKPGGVGMKSKVMEMPEPTLKTQGVVPGKGPPPEPPVDCCMSGCANCVWIAYAESLKDYYSDGGKSAREALEQIENPSLRMFVKLEMGLL